MAPNRRIVIRGGVLYDGTGAAGRGRDVVVERGRVTAVSPSTSAAEAGALHVIDAAGFAVAPGFIDIHTHSDISLVLDGRAQSKVHQGVTTEVIGNCGFSPFPITPERLGDHVDLLAGIGDDPVEPSWTDVDGYACLLERSGIAVNVAPLVGHGALRIASMGLADRSASSDELLTMQRLLEAMLEQGAFGLSTGLTYVPSRYAPADELTALGRILVARNRLYATHARSVAAGPMGAVEEAIAFGRDTECTIQFSHLAINHPDRWGMADQLLQHFEDARGRGIDIAYDVYPYDASASALTQYLPAWVQEGGVEAMQARLTDPDVRRRAETDLAMGFGSERIPWFWSHVVLSRTDGVLEAVEGDTIQKAAERKRMSPARYVLELCREGGNRVQVLLFYRTEEDMRTFLRHDYALIGSDGSAIPYGQRGRRPHPRAFGAQTRVLGRHVRELGDLDLATAIHRMTGAVAERLGLADRGTLTAGKAADIVVFDPSHVSDCATYADPCQPPVGVRYVLVNGEIVIDEGRQTNARPGVVLRAT